MKPRAFDPSPVRVGPERLCNLQVPWKKGLPTNKGTPLNSKPGDNLRSKPVLPFDSSLPHFVPPGASQLSGWATLCFQNSGSAARPELSCPMDAVGVMGVMFAVVLVAMVVVLLVIAAIVAAAAASARRCIALSWLRDASKAATICTSLPDPDGYVSK